jgi:hypothetical protein
MDIPGRIGAALGTSHRRKADKHGRLLPGLTQEGRGRDIAEVAVALESTVCAGSPRMDDSLGYLRWLHALVNNPPKAGHVVAQNRREAGPTRSWSKCCIFWR